MILAVWNRWCYQTGKPTRIHWKTIFKTILIDGEILRHLSLLALLGFSDEFENTGFHSHLSSIDLSLLFLLHIIGSESLKLSISLLWIVTFSTLYFNMFSHLSFTQPYLSLLRGNWGSRRLSDFFKFRHLIKNRKKPQTWVLATLGSESFPLCLASRIEM